MMETSLCMMQDSSHLCTIESSIFLFRNFYKMRKLTLSQDGRADQAAVLEFPRGSKSSGSLSKIQ